MIETLQPLLIITPVLLVLAFGIILFVFMYQRRMLQHQEHLRQLQETRQRQLLEAALEAQEAERRRVARDLHDEVGGMLALIRLNIGQVARQCADTAAGAGTAERAKHLLDDAIGSVRRISHDLMPVVLEKLGLVQAIKSMGQSLPADSGLELRFTHNLEQERLESRKELLLFRILQELLNNSLKYAQASLITVDLNKTAGSVTLSYTDNGLGFDYEPTLSGNGGATGLGLKNLESRVSLLNGVLHFNSVKGKGVKAEIIIPIL